jgi:hypothetical protein
MPGETGRPGHISNSSGARPREPEAAAPAAAADAAGARDEGQAVVAHLAEPSAETEKSFPAATTGKVHEARGSSAAVASFDGAAVDPLKEASAALEDRDYATAQRLFAAIGRKDVAEAIKDALAALDRKDYATAQRLFEQLVDKGAAAPQAKGSAPAGPASSIPAAPAGDPVAPDSRSRAPQKPVTSPPEVVPFADAAYRRPSPQAEKAKSRRLKPLLAGTGLALLAILGGSAIYGSPLSWTFPTTKSQAIAGLSSAADVLKADFAAITGQREREEQRPAAPDLSASLAQMSVRLDRIERENGARLDKLSERDQDSSSRLADIAARLDRLETKAALPAAPAPESADVVARLDKLEKKVAVAAAPVSEIAGLTTRLSKLEKRAALAGPGSGNPLPPVAPKRSSPEASTPNETARLDGQGPLLRDYSVENVRDGVAVVDSRYGQQEVAPGDSLPGAGRVLRIERRGGDWFVLTSRGVIASGPAP